MSDCKSERRYGLSVIVNLFKSSNSFKTALCSSVDRLSLKYFKSFVEFFLRNIFLNVLTYLFCWFFIFLSSLSLYSFSFFTIIPNVSRAILSFLLNFRLSSICALIFWIVSSDSAPIPALPIAVEDFLSKLFLFLESLEVLSDFVLLWLYL